MSAEGNAPEAGAPRIDVSFDALNRLPSLSDLGIRPEILEAVEAISELSGGQGVGPQEIELLLRFLFGHPACRSVRAAQSPLAARSGGEVMLIGFASKQVGRADAPADRSDLRLAPVFDPALRTLETPPDLHLKARKAISRELRHIKFRLYLSLLFLQIEKLSLEVRCGSLRILRNVARNLPKLILYRH